MKASTLLLAGTASALSSAPKCSSLNFDSKCKSGNYPCASGKISDVESVGNNVFEVKFSFDADNCADISNLGELKVIGLDSPDDGTVVVFSRNSGVTGLKDACHWSTTFRINGKAAGSQTCTPPFQVQYDWFSGAGVSSSDKSSWKYAASYDYLVGCSADNNGNSNADWPQYCWGGREEQSSAASSASSASSVASSVASSSVASSASSASSSSTLDSTFVSSTLPSTLVSVPQNSSITPTVVTKTAHSTTILTITSCSGGCHRKTVTTGVTVSTVTVNDVTSEVTTYCPLTYLSTITPTPTPSASLVVKTAHSTTVVTITSCSGGCTTKAVTTGVTVKTTTVNDIETEYTTYCPLTYTTEAEAAPSESSVPYVAPYTETDTGYASVSSVAAVQSEAASSAPATTLVSSSSAAHNGSAAASVSSFEGAANFLGTSSGFAAGVALFFCLLQ